MSLEFAHTGPHAVVHHQHYQMVDLLMQHCRKTMGGLNLCALPYAPLTPQIVAESANNKRNNKKNAESSKWHACKTKKGCRYKNINNNKNEKKIKLFGNQFSQLTEMVQDNHKVAEVLETAVDEEINLNINKEETTRNTHNVDSADMSILDAEMQKYED